MTGITRTRYGIIYEVRSTGAIIQRHLHPNKHSDTVACAPRRSPSHFYDVLIVRPSNWPRKARGLVKAFNDNLAPPAIRHFLSISERHILHRLNFSSRSRKTLRTPRRRSKLSQNATKLPIMLWDVGRLSVQMDLCSWLSSALTGGADHVQMRYPREQHAFLSAGLRAGGEQWAGFRCTGRGISEGASSAALPRSGAALVTNSILIGP